MMFVFIFMFWRMGGNTASKDVITTYKEQVEQLRTQVADLTSKVGILTGQLREKDDRIKTLESIATNQSPEMTTFIKRMNLALDTNTSVSQNAADYMKQSMDLLTSIDRKLSVKNRKR